VVPDLQVGQSLQFIVSLTVAALTKVCGDGRESASIGAEFGIDDRVNDARSLKGDKVKGKS
jgi:hypothetical protein